MDMEQTFFDELYPYIATPKCLDTGDELVNEHFRKMYKKYMPDQYGWRFLAGQTFEIGEGNKDNYKDPMWFWITRRYSLQNARLVESCEFSSCIHVINLGGGYKIHATGANPYNMTKAYNHVWAFDFLYKNEDLPPDGKTGTSRLKALIKYMAKCPQNPYTIIIIRPTGKELLDAYSPHLKTCNYIDTGHTTNQLKKLYAYTLRAEKTKLSADLFQDTDWYYKLNIYQPEDPIYTIDECPYPELR